MYTYKAMSCFLPMSLSFKNMTLATYKLDPAHYFTAPSLSWDAMLKLIGVKLQLVDDPDMYLIAESGIQDGVSMSTKNMQWQTTLWLKISMQASQPTTNVLGCQQPLRLGNVSKAIRERVRLDD